jgi:hypothetical protein
MRYANVVRSYGLLLLFFAAVTGLATEPSLGQVNLSRYDQSLLQLPSPCFGLMPSPSVPFCWIRLPSFGSQINTTNYYSGIGFSKTLPDTLGGFQSRNKFIPGGDVEGVYFNEGDLRLGRDMHCQQSGAKVACYVSNYGPPPFVINPPHPNPDWPNTQAALTDVINGVAGNALPFATVAMEYSPTPASKIVNVFESDGATPNRFPVSFCPLVGTIIGPNGIPGVDVDTGIDIEPGDLITFNASGSIWAGFCAHGDEGPNGFGGPDPKYPLPSAAGFSLIGRVGAGSYFFIGDGTQNGAQVAFPFSTGGRLFLRTNDDTPGNGSGFFSVSIKVDRQNVRFYVYDKNGVQVFDQVALDQEGPKPIPQMCMSCHGGSYHFDADRVTDASFLPFELSNLIFSQNPNFTAGAQEDKFRELNRLVTLTRPLDPTDPINELIIAGASAVQGWKGHDRLYNEFVRPYCRTCHAAARPTINWATYDQLKTNANLDDYLCKTALMPHAQATYDRLKSARFDGFIAGELRGLKLSCVEGELRLFLRRK